MYLMQVEYENVKMETDAEGKRATDCIAKTERIMRHADQNQMASTKKEQLLFIY